MGDQATNDEDTADPTVGSYHLPLAWRKQAPANDNRPSPLRRAKRIAWFLAAILALGGTLWTALQ